LGLDDFEEKEQNGQVNNKKCSKCNLFQQAGDGRELCKCEKPKWLQPSNKNIHPTVKPINLMAYLCRLITPKGGLILDPFMGSGATGIAARIEGFRFCGMEMQEEYYNISKARIDAYEEYKKLMK